MNTLIYVETTIPSFYTEARSAVETPLLVTPLELLESEDEDKT